MARFNPMEWPPLVQIVAALGVVGTVGGAITVLEPVYSMADPFQLANHGYVDDQTSKAAKTVVDAIAPRLDSLAGKVDAQGDDIVRARITADRASIITLGDQLATLMPLIADYPFNAVLQQQKRDIETQLTGMQAALAAAVCEMNQRRSPSFQCPAA